MIFSPHPDDVAIAIGGLVILAARLRIPMSVVQLTDGSEARMTDDFLSQHGWAAQWSRARSTRLRGSIRIAEAREELRRLNVPLSSFKLLEKQEWNTRQLTPRDAFYPDGSIRNVDQYRPAPVDREAVSEICGTFDRSVLEDTICAVPDSDDRLTMHRLTTAVVIDALLETAAETGKAVGGLLSYRCLSTNERGRPTQTIYLPFGENVMDQKCYAIRAHQSMLERRRLLGGYCNSGHEPYDVLVRRWNRDLGTKAGCARYAEAYSWIPQPSVDLLETLRDDAHRE